jgi:hypothetical protein
MKKSGRRHASRRCGVDAMNMREECRNRLGKRSQDTKSEIIASHIALSFGSPGWEIASWLSEFQNASAGAASVRGRAER